MKCACRELPPVTGLELLRRRSCECLRISHRILVLGILGYVDREPGLEPPTFFHLLRADEIGQRSTTRLTAEMPLVRQQKAGVYLLDAFPGHPVRGCREIRGGRDRRREQKR